MSLIRYNPRSLTPWFDLDRVFADFEPSAAPTRERAWAPAVDIYEDEKEITLNADLPDMDEKNIDVRVEDGQLTMRGERKIEKDEKKENYHRVERRYGSFVRTFGLPDTVDPDGIKAKYDKGVLRVTLPKREKPDTSRVIKVQ
jgi:HSP20 family protein